MQVLTLDRGFMLVHPDLIEDESQWTIVSNKKSKGNARTNPYNTVSSALKEEYSDLAPLTYTEEENIVLIAPMKATLADAAKPCQ